MADRFFTEDDDGVIRVGEAEVVEDKELAFELKVVAFLTKLNTPELKNILSLEITSAYELLANFLRPGLVRGTESLYRITDTTSIVDARKDLYIGFLVFSGLLERKDKEFLQAFLLEVTAKLRSQKSVLEQTEF